MKPGYEHRFAHFLSTAMRKLQFEVERAKVQKAAVLGHSVCLHSRLTPGHATTSQRECHHQQSFIPKYRPPDQKDLASIPGPFHLTGVILHINSKKPPFRGLGKEPVSRLRTCKARTSAISMRSRSGPRLDRQGKH